MALDIRSVQKSHFVKNQLRMTHTTVNYKLMCRVFFCFFVFLNNIALPINCFIGPGTQLNFHSGLGWVICYYLFQQNFSYIMTVSFSGRGNQSTQRKPPTCHKSLTILSHNVASSTPLHEQHSNSQISGDKQIA